MRTQRLIGGAMLLAAAVGATGAMSATGALAASCTGVTISKGQALSLDVSSVLVTKGGCVRFANLTDVTVTVTVSGSSFSDRLPARTPASASASFTATRSASITATDGVRTGHGTITVEKAPPTKSAVEPAPIRTTYSPPAPVGSTAPATSTKPPSITSDVPTAPAVSVQQTHSAAAVVVPSLPTLPPGPSHAATQPSRPVVAPRATPRPVVVEAATVLEPASSTGHGLPAAVAAVLLVGVAVAYGRVVLAAAPAVDNRAPRHLLRS